MLREGRPEVTLHLPGSSRGDTGASCDDPSARENDQGGRAGTEGDYTCSGPLDGDEPVQLVPLKKAARFGVEPAGQVLAVGDLVALAAADGKRLFPATKLALRQDGSDLQRISLHTSCSQPLNIGDQFGSLLLRYFINEQRR